MTDCLFCAIARGTEPAVTLFEDDVCSVFLDVFPASKGHLLIIPKQHVVTYDELSIEQSHHLAEVTRLICLSVMNSDLNPAGYNLQVNNGAAANQHVPHLHIHVIPRYRGDILKVMSHFILQAPGIFIGRKKHKTLEVVAEQLRAGLNRAMKAGGQ